MGISLKPDDFIYPYFVIPGRNKKEKINSFPGVYRYSTDTLLKEIRELKGLGINKILLFGIPERKDNLGSSAYKKDNITAIAIEKIKRDFPGLTIYTDVCLCSYTSHGHCGLLKNTKKEIDNKRTIDTLSKIALSHAKAGADWVAPSAMAKGQVLKIREALDKSGYNNTKILAYSAKFASNFYGPFRNAADSAPKFGDRRTYQLNFGNTEEALEEIDDDIKEGADMVMVKPALSYLDVIKEASQRFHFPLAAYNVSGEYVMVKYGAQLGFWDEKKIVLEVLTSIKRSGANIIITYHAKDVARWKTEA